MEPDTTGAVERAHLRAPGDRSHTMSRYAPPADLAPLVQRFWIPVWSVPPGQESVQRVLQYPVGLVVVSTGYARFYGVVTGLSETVLAGEGWAVGVMLTPAAGSLVSGVDMSTLTDRHVDIGELLGDPGRELADRVRTAMTRDPRDPAAHAAATAAFGDLLRPSLPVDAEGELVDRVVELVETRPDLVRVGQLCEATGLGERTLQRLVQRRLGLTPKWLVQRRRLQEAAERLRTGEGSLAATAALLGYADQAHFSRDWTSVVGTPPGRFVAEHRRPG
ncbi:helix-turn-helix domain-containing protein [Klenkia brasiliensis]|uniref:Transcriptional regulator, AraC family n=1 Tax=Klenkia brasiliensis TaxID=333142 RepID=A0A1G7MD52_9ACTN|nr:AraC family transcriptional regulator [Klenkia brasiliensis]SDF59737.1 transcriptional regulator, AraC family [Klenkia brasiliensis]